MQPIPEEAWQQVLTIRLLEGLTITQFFLLGACLGSFLNVLVWRWPRGRSVIREPSACPHCAQRIHWRDNLPILGWLLLGGRCRQCQQSIAIRYPLVELLVGLQCMVYLCAQALSGGATLPVRPIDHYAGVVWIVWYMMQPELLRIFALHFVLLYVADLIWLVDEDEQRLPWRLLPVTLITGLAAVACFPDLYPFDAGHFSRAMPVTWAQRGQALLQGGVGWLVGAITGLILAGIFGRSPASESRHTPSSEPNDPATNTPLNEASTDDETAPAITTGSAQADRSVNQRAGLLPFLVLQGSIGLALGWQAALTAAGIAVIVGGFRTGLQVAGLALWNRSSVFPVWVALHIQLFAWRWLEQQNWTPSTQGHWVVAAGWAGALGLVWIIAVIVQASFPKPR